MKVGVIGAAGRMGREVCKTVLAAGDMQLVFAVDIHPGAAEGYQIQTDLTAALQTKPDAVVDFTQAAAAEQSAVQCLRAGAIPIIGTSGLSQESLEQIAQVCDETGLPALYIPNFAVGAVLMMKFAQQAAEFFPNVELIEMHHDKKKDAPSGTAIRTAELIEAARKSPPNPPPTELLKHEGAAGAVVGQTHVHSVRLPGLVAHQIVIFGGPGELLTIRHDSMDRSSFMTGVLLALRRCRGKKGLLIGLEQVM